MTRRKRKTLWLTRRPVQSVIAGSSRVRSRCWKGCCSHMCSQWDECTNDALLWTGRPHGHTETSAVYLGIYFKWETQGCVVRFPAVGIVCLCGYGGKLVWVARWGGSKGDPGQNLPFSSQAKITIRKSRLGAVLSAGESPEDVCLVTILTTMLSQEAGGPAWDWPLPSRPGSQGRKSPWGASLGWKRSTYVLLLLCSWLAWASGHGVYFNSLLENPHDSCACSVRMYFLVFMVKNTTNPIIHSFPRSHVVTGPLASDSQSNILSISSLLMLFSFQKLFGTGKVFGALRGTIWLVNF